MFQNNDRFLKTVSTLLTFLVVITICIGVIAFFILLSEDMTGIGFLTLIVSCVSAFFTWLFGNLFLSFLCDVKLIRNKLYDVDNSNLNIFTPIDTEKESKTENENVNNEVNTDNE